MKKKKKKKTQRYTHTHTEIGWEPSCSAASGSVERSEPSDGRCRRIGGASGTRWGAQPPGRSIKSPGDQ